MTGWDNVVPGNILCALDLGTTKFCLAALYLDRPETDRPLIEIITVPAAGMRRGMVADMQQAAAALTKLLDAAENQLNIDIRRVVVGIAGSHLRGFDTSSELITNNEVIASTHISALQEKVEQTRIAADREILHVVPVSFDLDDRQSTQNPIGFSAQTLRGDFFLVDADRLYLKDIVRLCNQAGLEVARLYSEPLSSASVTLDDAKKEVGVAVCDIGGGTTDGVVYQAGRPRAAFSLNIGGAMLTSDLAVALNLSLAEAERAKVFFGLGTTKDADTTMVINNIKGDARTITAELVRPILAARLAELCQLLGQQLLPYKGKLGGGIVLTGGGSEVAGIDRLFQKIFRIPVTKACPSFVYQETPVSTENQDDETMQSALMYPSKYATVMGLLNLELGRIKDDESTRRVSWTSRYVNQLVRWLKDMS